MCETSVGAGALLVIDDCTAFPALLEREVRKKNRTATVIVIHDADQAIGHLDKCESGAMAPPGIVVLDRAMPRVSGHDVLQWIRQRERLLSIPVLMTSGMRSAEMEKKSRALGADGFLLKPTKAEEYPEYAATLLDWHGAESWRASGGAAADRALMRMQPGRSIVTMEAIESVSREAGTFDRLLGFFTSIAERAAQAATAAVDPFELAICDACRRHHIHVRHARGHEQDHVTVANRHRVIKELMSLGYSDAMIAESFQISQRGLERLRQELRKRGGNLALD